jgi:DNA-binding NarL/FixJ family response regulator
MFTILLIDSHPLALSGLHHLLESKLNDTSIVSWDNVETAAQNCDQFTPDLIILGVNDLLIKDGVKAVKKCRYLFPSVRLIINDFCTDFFRVSIYLQLGVKGCLGKGNPTDEILMCIESVLMGKFFLTARLTEALINNTIKSSEASQIRKGSKLTPRENEIAAYLCQGSRNTSISKILNIKASTISTIKKNIFTKLKVDSIIELRDIMKFD